MMEDLELPIRSEGRLPGGDHWTLALEVNDRGHFAHLMVAFAGGGAGNTGGGRAYGDGQVTDGPATASLDHLRSFTWAVRPDVDRLELLPAPTHDSQRAMPEEPQPVRADLIHDDSVMRVFLAVIDDGHARFDRAQALSADGTIMATEDLTEIQEEFSTNLRWLQAYRRGGTREAGPRPEPYMTDCEITQHVPDQPTTRPG